MENLINILRNHLAADENHTVKITPSGGKPIKREDAKKRKYQFTLEYIEQKYNSLENFLSLLRQKGFTKDIVFTLQKMYGEKESTTYHKVKEFKANLEEETMNNTHTPTQTHQQPVPTNTNPFPSFLGAPQMMQKYVDAARSEDYKKQLDKMEEQLKDAKSENRILREKNSSLEIKLNTAEERKEMAVERTKMEQKSFIESDAVTALAGAIPDIISKLPLGRQNPNAGALASPNVSPIKQQLFNIVNNNGISDEQIGLIIALLTGWNEDTQEQLIKILENN